MFKYRVHVVANNFNDKRFADIVLCAAGSSDVCEHVLTHIYRTTWRHTSKHPNLNKIM
jgi:fructoselysine-6-P-deglycase FrlB-like protein